jgi:hypothetical protein
MSLQAIAGVAFDRRSLGEHKPPGRRAGLETQQLGPDVQPVPPAQQPAAIPPSGAKQFNSALETLKRYIPTEFLALYLPFLAIAKDRSAQTEDVSLVMYIGFIVATPIAVFLIYLAKAAESGAPDAWKTPPVFECILATVAFAVWGASVPGMFPGQQWWIALLAMTSAFALPLLDSIFGKKSAKS